MENVIFRTVDIKNTNGSVTSVSEGNLQNHMHYYTSTNPQRVFWAEEGMAFGQSSEDLNTTEKESTINYIRCVRTLKSNNSGYGETPDMYYTYSNSTFELANVDATALRTTVVDGELNMHNEREELNRARASFRLSENAVTETTPKIKLTEGSVTGNYSYFNLQTIQTTFGDDSPCSKYSEAGGNWRIPNQREFALMILEGTLSGIATPYYACRTGYSGNHRYGYRFASNNLAMIEPNKLSFPNHIPQFANLTGWNQYNEGTPDGDNTAGKEDRYRVRCVSDQ